VEEEVDEKTCKNLRSSVESLIVVAGGGGGGGDDGVIV